MINVPKGTKDLLPEEAYKMQFIEDRLKRLAAVWGFLEIRTPTFESTELFLRGVGDTTDIVNKEMYTFSDKGGRSMTLKPEGTAGVVRSVIENGLLNGVLPLKVFYMTPVFRYERPQAGRLREHHQFGVEMFGADSVETDVEILLLADAVFKTFEIDGITLNINSIGCPDCRPQYTERLKKYFAKKKDEICPLCVERLAKNPLRLLDCKVENCRKIAEKAPKTTENLCFSCKDRLDKTVEILDRLSVKYVINPDIVRGLDYYTGTVFEFVSQNIGAQGTVLAGGRYNNLVKSLGGQDCPAIGFGTGLERLLMLVKDFGETYRPEVFIIGGGAFELAARLKQKGIAAECDLLGRSQKAQMKYANKKNFKKVIFLGEKNIIKDMDSGIEEDYEKNAY